MHPVTQDTFPPPGWLTKQTTSERLKLSESRCFALAEAGKIQTNKQKSPRSGQYVSLFHAGDVERLIFERENPGEQCLGLDGGASSVPVRADKPFRDPIMDVILERAGLQKAPAPTLKPWLTISEAAEYTGLPASIITKLVESAQLPALDCGPRPGGKWRIKRTDLDALEGQR